MQISREVRLGLTLVLALVLLTSMSLAVGRFNLTGKPVLELSISYKNVDGLREGAPVRYSGVDVGEVRFIQLSPDQVTVGLRIDRDVPIPVDSQFAIVTSGIIGERHVEIRPGKSNEYLKTGAEVVGHDPVTMDSLFTELHLSLKTLNTAAAQLAELASSDVLQASLIESANAVREMALSFEAMLSSANAMTLEIQQLTADLSSSELRKLVGDLAVFAEQLSQLDLARAVADITAFTSDLRSLPLQQTAQDIKAFSAQLAALDLSSWMAMGTDLQEFASQLKGLDLAVLEGAVLDLESFTGQLREFPVEQLGADLLELTTAAKELPIQEFAAGMRDFIVEVERLPLAEIVADLQRLTAELNNLGLRDMAADVQKFTAQLAAVDLKQPFEGITGDLERFSKQLAELDLIGLLSQVEDLVQSLQQAATLVDGQQVELAVADLAASAANIRRLTEDAGALLDELGSGAASASQAVTDLTVHLRASLLALEELVGDVGSFISALEADGATAQALINALESAASASAKLEKAAGSLSPEAVSSVVGALDSIQQINADIQALKGFAGELEVSGAVGLRYATSQDFGANVRLTLARQGEFPYLMVGFRDLVHGDTLQLQVGKAFSPNLRARVGLSGRQLGLGLDAMLRDELELSADLSLGSAPSLLIRGSYAFDPNWWMTVEAQDAFSKFSVGLEYRF